MGTAKSAIAKGVGFIFVTLGGLFVWGLVSSGDNLFKLFKKDPASHVIGLTPAIIQQSLKDPFSAHIENVKIISHQNVLNSEITNGDKHRDMWLLHADVRAKNSFGAYAQQGYCIYIVTKPGDYDHTYGTDAVQCDYGAPSELQVSAIKAMHSWDEMGQSNQRNPAPE